MGKLDCLFIGSITQDLIMLVEKPPASDRRIACTKMVRTAGGPAAVAAAAFQSLGGAAGLLTAVGNDEESTFILSEVESWSLPYAKVLRFPLSVSPFSVIQLERNGNRCITHYGGCMNGLTLSDIGQAPLRDAGMIHLAGLPDAFISEAARYCKEHSEAVISVDGGNYSRQATEALLPYTDIFIPDNKTAWETLGLLPEDACRYYCDQGAKLACVTIGSRGAVLYDGARFYHTQALPVGVLDTTGAGDNFHGAFLYCRLMKYSLQRALTFSSAYASLTCEGLGGRGAAPSAEKVLEILKQQKKYP